MKMLTLSNLGTAALTLALLVYGAPSHAWDDAARPYKFFNVDQKQFIEASIFKTPQDIYIRYKVSNGQQIRPFHAAATLTFTDSEGKELARHIAHVWCQASL